MSAIFRLLSVQDSVFCYPVKERGLCINQLSYYGPGALHESIDLGR